MTRHLVRAVGLALACAAAAPASAATLGADTTLTTPDPDHSAAGPFYIGGNDAIVPGHSPARPGTLQTFTLTTGGTFSSAEVWVGGDLDPAPDEFGMYDPENVTWFLFDASGFVEGNGASALTLLAQGDVVVSAEGNAVNRRVELDLGGTVVASTGVVYAIGLGNGGGRLQWNYGQGDYGAWSGNPEDPAPYASGAGYLEVIDGVDWDPTDTYVTQYHSHFERPSRETGLLDPEWEHYDVDFNLRVYIAAGTTAVPEPTSLALVGAGALVAARGARRRRVA